MSVSEKLSSTGTVRENSFHESQTTDSVFAEIKFEELKSSIECDGLVVIDVRSAAEIEDTGKLPRSFNIPREFMRTHEVRPVGRNKGEEDKRFLRPSCQRLIRSSEQGDHGGFKLTLDSGPM